MLKDNFLLGVSAFAATVVLGVQAYAVPGDLEIKVEKNADLLKESTLTNLTMESRFTEEKEKHLDQFEIGASFLNLGHPSVTTDQTSTYNMSGGTAIGAEYSHSFGAYHLTSTIGYDYIQQSSAATATALHVIPLGVMAEYVYKNWEKFRPFAGGGLLGIIQSQRGVDQENTTQFNGMPVLTIGADYKTPWNFKIHGRVRELIPLASAAQEFNGQIYDLGIVYSL
jgi:outer membrane protein W